ncbi:Subtilisin DY, putative [Perkinsus marinus ATCC 50983]|uniref:subtilisin n=1 Tax=Perkinsus marinus (strain ATCC 50983 / TXsc) TaxID=423536 RepID=C5K502_PERM5|nr:Subtilisin DY, putative [Perkinsus marinus ATCC 50983]EER20424.1 Subtilisin DY, putative [Perkinsus marinus ATCC 50983]|eukprot:XP_002788628.1 Subtilisin DY, putative [Perkinsus marinus ATCC 50983]
MLVRWTFLSTILVNGLLFVEGAPKRTLVRISHRGARLDIRLLPSMMAKTMTAFNGESYLLTSEDRECERCFAQDGMIYDLNAVGVQIVDSACSVGHSQILSYLRKAEITLGIDFDCEPDSVVTINPLSRPVRAQNSSNCTGGNPVLGTNDPGSSCQRSLEVIRIGAAWQAARSAKRKLREIVLAISDTGVDMTHPDLVHQFWRNPSDNSIGYNFITNSTNVTDDNEHGTHCAGNAAAQTNNSLGIAGVANIDGSVLSVKLMILKFVNASGRGWVSDEARALNFAVENGATVSSHSYGAYAPSPIARIAFENAAAAGHIAVAAAGNDGLTLEKSPVYPCSYAENITSLICVAASTSDPTKPISLVDWSDAGLITKIAAPGVGIYSTIPGGSYAARDGTSVSTPTVAGVAALLATLGLTGQNITDTIFESRTAAIPNKFDFYHIGEIDALKAVQKALEKLGGRSFRSS